MTGGNAMMHAAPPRRLIPALSPLYDGLADYAYPLIRIATGLWLMPHGAQKLFGAFGGNPAATAQFFGKVGLPDSMALVTWVGGVEFFGGLLLVLGLLTRVAAVMVFVLMMVAVFMVHLPNGFFWLKAGYEYPLLWAVLALAIAIRGGGQCSLDRKIGKEF
jgi:putative oxidoreductase